MKAILAVVTLILATVAVRGNEDHLVLVPTPITIVGDESEHTVIDVPYISGYGLDFLGYCHRIASPYIVDIRSPSSKNQKMDINPLSREGLVIGAQEIENGRKHIVTLNFEAVKNIARQSELLRIAARCVFEFGGRYTGDFEADLILEGVPKDSELHEVIRKFHADRETKKSNKSEMATPRKPSD